MIQPLLIFSDWAILIVRLALGLILMRHGLPKLRNLKSTGEWFQGIGFRPGAFWAVVAGLTEFVGGLALVLGFLTQLAALFVALEFLVVLIKFRKDKMFAKDSETELDWVILAAALILMTLGSGALSLERFLGLILY